MLTFLTLVVADTFGLTTFRLASEAWSLLQIGLGDMWWAGAQKNHTQNY
ncbi:hypothetical protein [Aliamphritea spongicola]|nr:hypothetical protein [Aliamphritea spongicola]